MLRVSRGTFARLRRRQARAHRVAAAIRAHALSHPAILAAAAASVCVSAARLACHSICQRRPFTPIGTIAMALIRRCRGVLRVHSSGVLAALALASAAAGAIVPTPSGLLQRGLPSCGGAAPRCSRESTWAVIAIPPPLDSWGGIPCSLCNCFPYAQPRSASCAHGMRGVRLRALPRPPTASRRGPFLGGQLTVLPARRNRSCHRVTVQRRGSSVGGTRDLAAASSVLGRIALRCKNGHGLTQSNGGGRCRNGSRPCRASGLGVPWPLAGDDGASVSASGLDSFPPLIDFAAQLRHGWSHASSRSAAKLNAASRGFNIGDGHLVMNHVVAQRRLRALPLRLPIVSYAPVMPLLITGATVFRVIRGEPLAEIDVHVLLCRARPRVFMFTDPLSDCINRRRVSPHAASLSHPPRTVMISVSVIRSAIVDRVWARGCVHAPQHVIVAVTVTMSLDTTSSVMIRLPSIRSISPPRAPPRLRRSPISTSVAGGWPDIIADFR